jgi:hypothetical protein
MPDPAVPGASGYGRGVTDGLVQFPSGNGRAKTNGGAVPAGGSGSRRIRHPWRFAIVAAGLVIAANLLWIAGHTADTSNQTARKLPSEVTQVLPAPGTQVRVQDTVGVDLRDDLTGVLVVVGVELPENQVSRVVPLGEVSFRPGKGKIFERLEPGSHSVSAIYWRQTKTRAEGTNVYTWSFRTG